MGRVFVYEYLSGGGGEGDAGTAGLLRDGVAMRDAIVADLLAVPDVEVTCAVSATAAAPPSGCACAAPHPGEPAAAFVQRLARSHDHAWIVAPETDGVLAALHDAVDEGRWIGCSAEAIRVASSKRATLVALAAHGVPTPLAFGAPAGRERWVVKPDDGAGTTATRVHADAAAAAADLRRRREAGSSVTMEPWIDGDALSLSMLAGDDAVEAVAFNRQHIDIAADGTLAWHGVKHHVIDPVHDARAPRLHALAAAVGRALPGLRGFVGVDLVWHRERGPVAIEVNPRVTCAYVGLSATLGRNLAADVLARHARKERADVAS